MIEIAQILALALGIPLGFGLFVVILLWALHKWAP